MEAQLSDDVKAYLEKIGSRGGRSRAQKHGPKQRRAWARLGGHPFEPTEKRLAKLKSRFETDEKLAKARYEKSIETLKAKHQQAIKGKRGRVDKFMKRFEEYLESRRNSFELKAQARMERYLEDVVRIKAEAVIVADKKKEAENNLL